MTGMTINRFSVGALAFALVASACVQKEEATDQTVQDTVTTAPAAAPAPGAPSDAEIAHIVVTANTIDIDAGKVAKEHSKNAQVTEFAQRMITDHTGVNEQAGALAQRLNLTPVDNATSQTLTTSANANLANLGNLSGAGFDRAYIANEVTYHQQVLDAIDNTLIPNAQNADLKALLQATRPAIAAHLDMAKQLQGKLGQ